MKMRLSSAKTDKELGKEKQEILSPQRYEPILTALGIGAFCFALVKSIFLLSPNDLRTAPLLAMNAALAVSIALGYASYIGTLKERGAVWWSVLYALWVAAVFHLVPAFGNDIALFYSRSVTGDAPYVIAFTVGRGIIICALAYPFSHRVLRADGALVWDIEEEQRNLVIITVITFYIVLSVIRLIEMRY